MYGHTVLYGSTNYQPGWLIIQSHIELFFFYHAEQVGGQVILISH